MKKILEIAALVILTSAAYAETTGNVSLTTDYRFRGISQSQNSQAIQGGVDYSHASGFYIGNWNSSVSTALYPHAAGIENDLYVGFKKEFMGVTLNAGSYNYFYQRAATSTGAKFDTKEVYASVSYGPITVMYNRSIGDYFAVSNSKGTQYYQAEVNQIIIPNLTLNAHVGRTDFKNHTTLNYTDYKLGATYNISGIDIGAHYYSNAAFGKNVRVANLSDGQTLYKDAVVFSVSKSF